MYTLLTGATGLVGRYLVRDLLLNGHHLAVVVRSSRRQSAADRIEAVMQHWDQELGRALPRPVVLEGDIAEPNLGLSDDDQAWIGRHVASIIHNAALLEFHGEDRAAEPWRTNLGGTRNVIALCRERGIQDIHYVSTAYVAGLQDGIVLEDSLNVGQAFRNAYEESKYLAEQEVRAIDFADDVTVYRPAVIAGDSVTGYTNTWHGLYLYLRLTALMIPAVPPDENGIRYTPIRLHMSGNERRNIVPVDWVSSVMVRLFESSDARGGTYHLAPDIPVTSGDIIRFCERYFNTSGVTLCGTDWSVAETSVDEQNDPAHDERPTRDDNEDEWLFEKLYTENMGMYAPYERTDNFFDLANTKRFAGDIVCPPIDDTVLRRYMEFGIEDRWGKTRPSAVIVSSGPAELLGILHRQIDPTDTPAGRIGLDVRGAGGGQWTIELGATGLRSIERGLPNGDAPIAFLDADTLTECVDRPEILKQALVDAIEYPDASSIRAMRQQVAQSLESLSAAPA